MQKQSEHLQPHNIGPIAVNATCLKAPITGVGRYTLELMRELEKQEAVSPHFFYDSHWSDRASVDNRARRKITRKLLSKGLPRPYSLAQGLRQRCFDEGIHRYAPVLYHEPNYIPLQFDGPTVLTVHDLTPFDFPETQPRARVRWIRKELPPAIASANAVLTVSTPVRDAIIERFDINPEQVFITPNGIGAGFRPRSEAAFLQRQSDFEPAYGKYILSVATFEPRKNLAALVDAFGRLPEGLRRRYPLVLAGAPGWGHSPEQTQLARLVDRGEAIIPGHVEEARLQMLYAGAALFVLPSRYEGFGLPAAEAMASGTAVITSGRGGLSDVVGDCGLCIEPDDHKSLSLSIEELLENEELRQALAERGRKQAEFFTWQACAERTLNAYRQVLENPHIPACSRGK